ncbi:MAG: hypothetical protein NC311_06405 [Muribaculaceae bacterium]|nr:hypothetical protein [Muribaculaceae bacterium]
MRKGKGQLTHGQYRQVNNLLRRENASLRRQIAKLQNDYNSLKVAHNKMLKDKETLDGMPHVKHMLQQTEGMLGILGGLHY